jgi:hypothetical protein
MTKKSIGQFQVRESFFLAQVNPLSKNRKTRLQPLRPYWALASSLPKGKIRVKEQLRLINYLLK